MNAASDNFKRFLIIDEHADERALASIVLRDHWPGAEIALAGGAVEFAEALAGEAFGAAVIDPRLSWAAGADVAAAVRRRWPGCAIVGFTVAENFEAAVRALRGIAAEIMSKSPANFVRLPAAIEAAMAAPSSRDADAEGLRRQLDELSRRAEDLARSNAALSEFASVVAHDLQEPLRSIQHYTQKLAQRSEETLTTAGRKNLGYAIEGANRMQAMIDDLLTYARLGRGKFHAEPVEMNSAVDDALRTLGPALEAANASVTRDDLPVIPAMHGQIVQMFQNLIGNAVKFRGAAPPRIHISAHSEDDEWVLSVQDNGIGIAPKDAEQIFEVFHRLHRSEEYAGTGMGLAICRQIAVNHGGRIWVESQPGRGATFFVALPRRQGAANGAPSRETVSA